MADKLITPEFRASYVFLFTPQENKQDDGKVKKEYTVTAIFPKGADLKPLQAAAMKALSDKYGADQSKWPTNLRSPFRKCKDRWKNEGGKQTIPPGYEDGDAVFITLKASEKYRPGVVDAAVQDIIEPRILYSGCYCRASVRPYVYDNKGNKGVSFGLNNVQKLRDGEPLGGVSRPTDDFEPVADAAGEGTGGGMTAATIFGT